MASFEQGENRKWSVRFRFIEFGQVKQKRLSGFDTKKEADKAYAEFMTTHTASKKSDYSNMTFKELYDNYLNHKQSKVKVSTIYDLKLSFNKHILPVFGKMKVFKITKNDILAWQDGLVAKKYSYKFESKLRTYLFSLFKYAVMYYDLPLNPLTQVEPFKRVELKKEMQIWSKEEFQKFISTFEDNLLYKTFFSFLYLTGCRKGESLALTWEKINFNTNIVTIDSNLTFKVENKTYAIVAPKTGQNRVLLLPNNLIYLLKELKANIEEFNPTYFVFGGKTPLALSTITRIFNKHIQIANIKKIRIHDLRHSHASLLISNGESIVMVAKRLGHSSIEQTLNTYSHLMPNEEENMLKKLDFSI